MRTNASTRTLRLAGAAALLITAPAAQAAGTPAATGAQPSLSDVGPQIVTAARATHGAAQRRVTRAARRVVRARGQHRVPKRYTAARLSDHTIPALEKRELHLRSELRRLRAQPRTPAVLQAIASCESGGDPTTDTGNGFYGKYQFTMSTWQAVGGSGNPAQAPEAEQDRRAMQLYRTAGAGQWPVCGR